MKGSPLSIFAHSSSRPMFATTLRLPLSKKCHQLSCRDRAGAIRTDGGRGGAVADKMNPRVLGNLRGQLAGHGYAAAEFAQHQRRQVIQGAAKSGAPEYNVRAKRGAVGPADAVFEDLAEHRQPVQHAPCLHCLDRRGHGQPGYRNYGVGWQAAAYPVFDQRHGGTTAVLGEGARAELRRSAAYPRRGGHARDLVEQLYRRDTAADDDHVLACELPGRPVILGVQLPAPEPVRAGIHGDVRLLPRARGVDHPAGRQVPPVRLDPEPFAAITDDLHLYGPINGEAEGLLVSREIPRHRNAGLHFCSIGIDRLGKAHPRQIVNAVDGAQPKRRPAELPGASRLRRLIQHDESRPGASPRFLRWYAEDSPAWPAPITTMLVLSATRDVGGRVDEGWGGLEALVPSEEFFVLIAVRIL